MSLSFAWIIWIVATVYATFQFYQLVQLVHSSSEDLWCERTEDCGQTFDPAASVAKGALWYWFAATALLVSRLWPRWPEAAVLSAATVLFTLLGSVATFWPVDRAQPHPSPEPPGDHRQSLSESSIEDEED